ncbi:succinyldiaminopimelate aminotransferase [Sediminihabitans luteus]|uniref:Succinyldiaminopimelate aminotransferase n=1 Tax=Sediminihabitans luteus TaxID=1138585 RepID=A0A2M9CYS1_9CELL|nr:succinyldiaminopimelate transaminase [Sediminihabitans luteus]PJJ77003.1 succinyldiaminopimelate aminotransferase [Sediminihabitans luteus]GII99645.1 aminotransferase [Sediminihabitans luteus]
MGLADLSGLAYPWDTLAPYVATARAHPRGLVDLSIGTPVDPTPAVVRDALAAASDAHGYPTTHGTPALREAVASWFARRRGVPGLDPDGVLPTVGSKELVGLLPSLLGLGAGDVVVHPATAYPTYNVGARLAGATPLATDDVDAWAGRTDVRLVWVNSPSNPTGAVADRAHLARVVAAARAIGAVVASDECYAELAWEGHAATDGVASILDPEVCDGSHEGLLAVYSLSKQSNVAGYRAAFVAGDVALVGRLLATRKHLGMIVPAPVQAAMVAALGDDAHVDAQREVYRSRRVALRGAVESAGFVVDHSEAGLYLWVRAADGAGPGGTVPADGPRPGDTVPADGPGPGDTGSAPCWGLVGDLAARGILVGPGAFYGEAGRAHVRIALTASDERVAEAVARLTGA